MGSNNKIGNYLVSAGFITEKQLKRVLEVQNNYSGAKRFGEIVIELGMLSETEFIRVLSDKLRIPFLDIGNVRINEQAAEKIPEAIARKYTVIGVNIQGGRLVVATEDPINFNILEDIKITAGMDIFPVFAARSAILKTIEKIYQRRQVEGVVEFVNQQITEESEADDGSEERIESAPIVKLAVTIVEQAFLADATDIHIEPFEKHTKIRIRINGDLIELMNISNAAHNSLTTRIKLISNMNIAEKRIPQDGRFSQEVNGVKLDIRVSSLPTVNGEKLVMRILSAGGAALRKVTELGMTDYNYKMYEKMLKCPHGLILVTGPTGSGKTTTLYSSLEEVAEPDVNVVTVEDPVEKRIDGINQVQINNKSGMTFAAALRSILRQDPDIIMIGEMRDEETAEIGIRAAITGHLVFSTLHTNDAASTITRLIDMGVPAYMAASSLIGVVAQRLVKILCGKCKIKRFTSAEENELLGINKSIEVYEAVGCSECSNTGYKGRTAIHEIIHCTGSIKEIIVNGADKELIERKAKENGARMLSDNAADLVIAGKTSIKEFLRVTYSI